ncbi:MAG: hypothetical protein GF350_15505, partial [Chitinivibrionales bacterium]|nr:hypothetical protein [Chitinivibrionales bacterium]
MSRRRSKTMPRTGKPETDAGAGSRLSRLLFKNLINGALHVAVIRNRRGVITDFIILNINKAWERIAGRTRRQVLGKRMRSVFPGMDKTLFEFAAEVPANGRGKKCEYHSLMFGKWFQVSLFSPAADECVFIFADTTAVRQSEERRVRDEKAFRAILNATAETAMLVDKKGAILIANRTASDRLKKEQQRIDRQ